MVDDAEPHDPASDGWFGRRWAVFAGRLPVAPMTATLGWLAVGGTLLGSVVGMCGGGVIVAIALLLTMGLPAGQPPTIAAMPTAVLAAGTWLQFAAFLAVVVGLAFVCARPAREAFAWRAPGLRGWVAAALGGATVGLFPSWVAEHLMDLLPQMDAGMLSELNGMLAGGPLPGRLLLLGAVVIGAPIVEELMFRGFLWTAMRAIGGDMFAWLGTSALFAMYHVDPVHVAAVSITGLYLGWLRRVTGSIAPGILAHFVNNALAAGVAIAVGPTIGEASTPGWLAGVGGLLTLGIAVAAGTSDADRRRRTATE